MEHPICGSGQGSTDGTAGWTSVCNTLLKVYSDCAESEGVEDPTGEITLKEAISAFIDDVKTRHMGKHREADEKDLHEITIKDTQKWVNLQWASGGSFNRTKSFVVPTIWRFARTVSQTGNLK